MNGSYQVRFQSLFDPCQAVCFPCDEHGQVNMDTLNDTTRDCYLYARAVVGVEYGRPSVCVGRPH